MERVAAAGRRGTQDGPTASYCSASPWSATLAEGLGEFGLSWDGGADRADG